MIEIKEINRRGDVPISILVLGVVAVCALAIISFSISGNSARNNLGIGIMEEIYSAVEEFHFYLNAGFSEQEALERMLFQTELEAEISAGKLIVVGKYENSGEEMDVRYIADVPTVD